MSSFDNKIFGQNLRKYRKMRELSQENIAMLLGKTKATISKYENGDLIMTADDIAKVCDELGIYSSDLFEQEYKNINKDNSNNPFKSKSYMYIFMLIIIEQENMEKVNMY